MLAFLEKLGCKESDFETNCADLPGTPDFASRKVPPFTLQTDCCTPCAQGGLARLRFFAQERRTTLRLLTHNFGNLHTVQGCDFRQRVLLASSPQQHGRLRRVGMQSVHTPVHQQDVLGRQVHPEC
jgi:hypothetical protein